MQQRSHQSAPDESSSHEETKQLGSDLKQIDQTHEKPDESPDEEPYDEPRLFLKRFVMASDEDLKKFIWTLQNGQNELFDPAEINGLVKSRNMRRRIVLAFVMGSNWENEGLSVIEEEDKRESEESEIVQGGDCEPKRAVEGCRSVENKVAENRIQQVFNRRIYFHSDPINNNSQVPQLDEALSCQQNEPSMAAQISNLANSALVEEEDSDSDSDLECYGCVDEVTEEKKES